MRCISNKQTTIKKNKKLMKKITSKIKSNSKSEVNDICLR